MRTVTSGPMPKSVVVGPRRPCVVVVGGVACHRSPLGRLKLALEHRRSRRPWPVERSCAPVLLSSHALFSSACPPARRLDASTRRSTRWAGRGAARLALPPPRRLRRLGGDERSSRCSPSRAAPPACRTSVAVAPALRSAARPPHRCTWHDRAPQGSSSVRRTASNSSRSAGSGRALGPLRLGVHRSPLLVAQALTVPAPSTIPSCCCVEVASPTPVRRRPRRACPPRAPRVLGVLARHVSPRRSSCSDRCRSAARDAAARRVGARDRARAASARSSARSLRDGLARAAARRGTRGGRRRRHSPRSPRATVGRPFLHRRRAGRPRSKVPRCELCPSPGSRRPRSRTRQSSGRVRMIPSRRGGPRGAGVGLRAASCAGGSRRTTAA